MTQIEAVSQFLDFPLVFVTGKVVRKSHGGKVERQNYAPAYRRRYTGFTEVGLRLRQLSV